MMHPGTIPMTASSPSTDAVPQAQQRRPCVRRSFLVLWRLGEAGRVLTAVAGVLVALLLVGSPCFAGPPDDTPDHPATLYWLRNTTGHGRELGEMDPRIEEVASAFGRGSYEECRRLAQALLGGADDLDLRSQAVSFIVESHLAQGDFEGARAAADRFGDEQALSRVNSLEARYNAEVRRIEEVIAYGPDARSVAGAQLALATVHDSFGKVRPACETYARAIRTLPRNPLASAAARRLIAVYQRQGGTASADAVARWILGTFSGSPWACLPAARTVAGARVEQVGGTAPPSEIARLVDTHAAEGAKLAFKVVLAEFEEGEGRLAEARDIYRFLLREAPAFAGHLAARDHLYRLAQLDCRILEQAVLHAEDIPDYRDLVGRAEALLAEKDLEPEVEWPLRACLAQCRADAGGGTPEAITRGIDALHTLPLKRPSVAEAGRAYRVLGLLLMAVDRCEEAMEVWQIAVDALPDSVVRGEIAIRLGDLLSSRDQVVDARKSYEHALACPDPQLQACGHERLGKLCEMERNLPAALQHYEAAVRICPASFAGQKATQRLDELEKEESP